LADPESGAYFEQLVFEVEDLRPEPFERAWRELMSRHAVLRTAVLWEGLPEPVQAVSREVPFALRREEWAGEEAFARLLEEDRGRGFELGRAPLMRVTVLEPGGGRQRVVWSMH